MNKDELLAKYGQLFYDTVLKSEPAVLRDLSRKVSDDVGRAILQTITLPQLSSVDRIGIVRNATLTAIDLFATSLLPLTQNKTMEEARKIAFDVLINSYKRNAETIADLDKALEAKLNAFFGG